MPASPSPSRTGTCSTTRRRGAKPRPARVEERLAKLADPARRAALRDKLPIAATGAAAADRHRRTAARRRTRAGSTIRWPMAAETMGKHPVDAMLDIAVEPTDLKTEFFAAPPNGKIEHLKELIDDPVRAVRRLRRRRPHQVPDRRPLSDRDAVQGRARARDAEPGGGPLAAVRAAGRGRRLPRPRRAARRARRPTSWSTTSTG